MHETRVTLRVRMIFVVAIALLAGQTLFIRRYGEPYPAFVMPAFEGARGYHDGRIGIRRHEVVVVADGQSHSFPLKSLLDGIPVSQHGEIALSIFRSKGQPLPAVPQSRWGRMRDSLFPGYASRRTSPYTAENTESLRTWLQTRGEALVPGAKVSRVEIRCFVDIVRFDSGRSGSDEMHYGRQPIDTYVVNCEPGRS